MKYWEQKEVIDHSRNILDSYQRITGVSLFEQVHSDEYKSYLLYHAPFVVLSHGIQADPIFNYANLTGQQLWVLNWNEFVQMPSRLSAEPDKQEDREHALSEVSKNGFVHHYNGIRKASTGKRFRIEEVTLWNVSDNKQHYAGMAALFRKWTNLS